MKKRKRRKKSEAVKIIEYVSVYAIILAVQALPLRVAKIISSILGDILYFLVKRRRTIAEDNLRNAFSNNLNDTEVKRIARESCRAFIFTFLEIIKLRRFYTRPNALKTLESTTDNLVDLFKKAKKTHDESNGCIFVTPHIGNWEVLPHVSAAAGIPLAIVARPLDNQYLEKLIYADRTSSGQILIPKKNALFVLQKTLQQGKSIGMLPDQSTMKGLMIDFFGRKATTTPVPAMLAVTYKRPIIVVACCRKEGDYRYEGFVSDPIWPAESYESEKAEIIRITEEMTRKMEDIIRKYPEQYLWIHNRWKTYKGKKEILS